MPTDWTVERVEELRRLYTSGDSASVIAAAIGGGATRNAVIGKIHRLGLEPRGHRTVDTAERERRKQAERIRHANNQRIRRASERGERPPVLEFLPVPAPFEGALNLPFDDLRMLRSDQSNQCRYPEGDAPPFLYCGNETEVGSSWCGHHHLVCHASQERQKFKVVGARRGMKASNFSGSFEPA